MNNNKKRRIAVAIAIIIFVLSAMTRLNKKEETSYDLQKDVLSRLGYGTENIIQGSNPLDKILVVNVDGPIMTNENNEFTVEELKLAQDDDTIKGVIMHINTPGGSVYASERIYNAIEKVKERGKPVYTVMQELAASGGYYISAPTNKIYASNDTRTGSIGVIMSSYSLEGLFDKYGIKEQNITTGKMKDAGSMGSTLDSEEREYFQGLVNSAFERFVNIVAKGRNMDVAEVKKLADGRIYDGSQAKENGLIDEIGDLEKACDDMATEYGLTDPIVLEHQPILNQFSGLFSKIDNYNRAHKSDIEAIRQLMKDSAPMPMYMFGGYDE